MRLELRGSGIKVVTINPGPIASMFVKNARAAFEKNIDMTHSHYKADFEKQRRRLDKGGTGRFKLPPEAVLAKLILALEKPNPRAHYYVTIPTHVAAFMRRILPSGLLDAFADRNS